MVLNYYKELLLKTAYVEVENLYVFLVEIYFFTD